MGRKTGGNPGDVRKSALWGSGNRGGEHRSNALWGKGGRGAIVTLFAVLVLSLAAGSVTGQALLRAVALRSRQRRGAGPARDVRRPIRAKGSSIIVQSAISAKAAESAFKTVESRRPAARDRGEAGRARLRRLRTSSPRSPSRSAAKARCKAERERYRAEREAARSCCASRRAVSSTTGSTSSAVSRSRCRVGGCEGSPASRVSSSPRTSGRCSSTRLRRYGQLQLHVEAAVGVRVGRQRALVRDAASDAGDRDRGLGHRHDPARLRRAERQAGQLRQLGQDERRARRSRSRQLRRRHRCRLGERTTPAWLRMLRSSRSTSWTTPAPAGRVT